MKTIEDTKGNENKSRDVSPAIRRRLLFSFLYSRFNSVFKQLRLSFNELALLTPKAGRGV